MYTTKKIYSFTKGPLKKLYKELMKTEVHGRTPDPIYEFDIVDERAKWNGVYPVRELDCESYDACLNIAALCNSSVFSCLRCPIYHCVEQKKLNEELHQQRIKYASEKQNKNPLDLLGYKRADLKLKSEILDIKKNLRNCGNKTRLSVLQKRRIKQEIAKEINAEYEFIMD